MLDRDGGEVGVRRKVPRHSNGAEKALQKDKTRACLAGVANPGLSFWHRHQDEAFALGGSRESVV
jgi:hypothetical protein